MLIDFPSVINREEIYYLILESSYFLAINSIQTKKLDRLNKTIDYYNQFNDNFPESSYNEEVKKIPRWLFFKILVGFMSLVFFFPPMWGEGTRYLLDQFGQAGEDCVQGALDPFLQGRHDFLLKK